MDAEKLDIFVLELQKEVCDLACIVKTREYRSDELCRRIEKNVGEAKDIAGIIQSINLIFDKNYEIDIFQIVGHYSNPCKQE
ncbi:MAG: hypothetical protein ISS23_03265 [Nanoarchaeota archaeon]|nr:hypothetical protein [Nanoarchaeota archaeon]